MLFHATRLHQASLMRLGLFFFPINNPQRDFRNNVMAFQCLPASPLQAHEIDLLLTELQALCMHRIDKIKNMLLQSPQDCFLNHALGLEYLKEENLNEAILSFQKVLQSNEAYVGTYFHLAKALFVNNEKEEAMKVFRKGIEIATQLKDLHARNELQMALEELDDE